MNAHQKIIKDNVRSILKIITNHYGVKYSAALYQILKEHPDFPSFLSFQYILHRMGKDSFAIHTSYEELTNMPAPFIVHGVTNVDLFLFITKATAESVQIIDEKGKEESIKKEDFEKIKNEWRAHSCTEVQTVDEDDIAKVVSIWTKVPVERLTEKESDKLLHLEDILKKSKNN